MYDLSISVSDSLPVDASAYSSVQLSDFAVAAMRTPKEGIEVQVRMEGVRLIESKSVLFSSS